MSAMRIPPQTFEHDPPPPSLRIAGRARAPLGSANGDLTAPVEREQNEPTQRTAH